MTEALVTDHAPVPGAEPIEGVTVRGHVKVAGRVRSLRIQPWADTIATLELTLVDDTGGITVVFLGRRRIAGISLGSHLAVEGTVVVSHGKLAILNPSYTLLARHDEPEAKPPRWRRRSRERLTPRR